MYSKNLLIVLVLYIFFSLPTNAQNSFDLLFEDEFENGLTLYQMYGSPTPVIVDSIDGRSFVFDNRGDANYASGVISDEEFLLDGEVSIEAEVYLSFSDSTGCWNMASFGLTRESEPSLSSNGISGGSGVFFGISANGDACWATPAEFRRQTYFNISIYAEDETGHSPESYSIKADGFANSWQKLIINIREDNYVEFYASDSLIWTSEKKLHPSIRNNRNLFLGNRSSGSAGKSYHDYLMLYEGSPRYQYDNFGITQFYYDDTSNWDATVDSLFGGGYRVADWNDLIAYHEDGNDLLRLYDRLGLTDYNNSVYVTRSGDRNYSDTRYYFASRHEGNKPGHYLAHDNIDNYLLSLGSWYGRNNILVFKESEVSNNTEIYVHFGDDRTASLGDTVNIPVILSSDSGSFESFEFDLGFPDENLSFYSIKTENTLAENIFLEVNDLQDKILVSGAFSNPITANDTLITLNFVVIDEGMSELIWNSFYFNEGDPFASTQNGYITTNGRKCGDVTNDGFVTNEDATWILRHGVKLAPQFPFVGEDSLSADVTANGWISAYDAAQVLKDVVGLDRAFNCEAPLNTKITPLFADLEWDRIESNTGITIPLQANVTEGTLEAIDIEVTIPAGFSFSGLEMQNTEWLYASNQKEGNLLLSFIGNSDSKQVDLGLLNFTGTGNANEFKATAHLNEQNVSELYFEEESDTPIKVKLFQNYPNPFNPSTTISYAIPDEGLVQLTIYNALGQQVAELVNEVKQTGTHSAVWDANNQASGIYVYKITYGNTVSSRKLMLIK